MIKGANAYLGEDHDQETQAYSRQHLESKGQLPLGIITGRKSNVCAIGDPCGAESAYSKHELLQGCDSATNTGMTDLGLVEWNNHGKETDARTCKYISLKMPEFEDLPKAGKESSSIQERDVLCTGLKASSQAEEQAAKGDCLSST